MSEIKLKRKRKPHSEEAKRKMRESALKRDKTAYKTHGFCSDYPKLYEVWLTMKNRCENPNRAKYKDYGARGIKVCQEWHDAETFCRWALENGYKEGLQIDRIDVNGNYEPSNCRWVTPKENSRNKRNTVFLTVNGETKCVTEWCELVGISPYTVYWWIKSSGKEIAEKRVEAAIDIVRGGRE